MAFTGPLSNSVGDDEEDTDEGGYVFCLSRRVFGSFFDGAETLILWRRGAIMVHFDHRIRNFHTARVERRCGRQVDADATTGLIAAAESQRADTRVVTLEDGTVLGEIANVASMQFNYGNILVRGKEGTYVHYVFE